MKIVKWYYFLVEKWRAYVGFSQIFATESFVTLVLCF